MINLDNCVTRFAHTAEVIAHLLKDVSPEQARWRPSPDAWSILEVINHLYDEEREDFRQRLEILLYQPEAEMPPIDPQGWVTSRQYNEREAAASLANFLQERQQSLDWLRGLLEPDWESGVMAPNGRKFRAGEMLCSWLAHDFLHIRQLNELHYAYWQQTADPYDVTYAGDW
ncbi:MAG: DinB family protein [Ardenticatenaceae bacterium]|nr:DinB family protein [Ardenticatenaceae bacterium]